MTWLNEIVQDLQLENVQVLRARGEQVEELPGGSAPDVVTVAGGGWIASGPPGVDRMPRPVWPAGLQMAAREMAGDAAASVSALATRDDLRAILDLSPREVAVFAPLVLLTLWMGIYPSSFTQFFDATVAAMVENHQAALSATRLAGAAP